MPQNTILQRTFIWIKTSVWKWDLSLHTSVHRLRSPRVGKNLFVHLVYLARQLHTRIPDLWSEPPDLGCGHKITGVSRKENRASRHESSQPFFELPNKKALQHKYTVKHLEDATDSHFFSEETLSAGPRYLNNSQFESKGGTHTHPSHPYSLALHWIKSILRREAWTVFTVFAMCFPVRLLVDVWDFSSIRLSLDPFLLWWTVEPPEPWASEERVTGSGGTRSVFEFTSERTDRSPSEHWDLRYWR